MADVDLQCSVPGCPLQTLIDHSVLIRWRLLSLATTTLTLPYQVNSETAACRGPKLDRPRMAVEERGLEHHHPPSLKLQILVSSHVFVQCQGSEMLHS